MSDVLMARENLRLTFAPEYDGEKDASRLARALKVLRSTSRKMGIEQAWTARRLRSFWYDEARLVRSYEMKVIEHARQIAEAKKDYLDLHRLRVRLEQTEPAKAGVEITTVRQMERQAWRLYRLLDGEALG